MDEAPNDLYLKTFIHVWLQTLKDYDSQLFSVITAPLIELARDESVQSKVLDVARQFFSNSNITINLIPALIAGGLLLLLLPLLFLFLAPADDAGSGYGAPAAEYGAPSSSYGAPSSSYGYRAVSHHYTLRQYG